MCKRSNRPGAEKTASFGIELSTLLHRPNAVQEYDSGQRKSGSWQRPIGSGYACHLIWVESIVPGRVPNFEEVEPDVKTAWLADQKAEQWHKTYGKMSAKYEVPESKPPEEPASANAPDSRQVAP
jgi:hypothetical protein